MNGKIDSECYHILVVRIASHRIAFENDVVPAMLKIVIWQHNCGHAQIVLPIRIVIQHVKILFTYECDSVSLAVGFAFFCGHCRGSECDESFLYISKIAVILKKKTKNHLGYFT